jgi:uncharacterized protein (TIGR02118 family)
MSATPPDGGVRLFAFVKRREGMSREEFLDYWHTRHGPLIRDTPELRRHLLAYEQHPARPDDRSGWDGVAVQQFASWDDFIAMISGPAGEAMRTDEANFLESSAIKVVFTDDPVVVIPPAPSDEAAS